jgi:hypothetical protein
MKRQRAQQDSIYNAKNGGVGADAEGKSKYDDGGESGRLAKNANCVANVLPK